MSENTFPCDQEGIGLLSFMPLDLVTVALPGFHASSGADITGSVRLRLILYLYNN